MRVVLVRLSALGDVVHTWPLAAALKESRPEIRLTWVVEESFLPLVEGHPAVDEVLPAATKRWRRNPFSARTRREIAALRSRLAALDADLCLDPQGVAKAALITRWSRARRRVGLARPWRRELLSALAYTDTLAVTAPHAHVVRINLELLRAIGEEPPAEPPAPDGSWLRDLYAPAGQGSNAGAVVLPGTGHPAKRLPAHVLAAVCRGLAAIGLDVVVAWGPGEREQAEAVADEAGAAIAPPTSLEELIGLLGPAAVVIGGDTGPVHLAAALGTPTVGVFTATDPRRNRPLGPAVEVVSTVTPGGAGRSGSARVAPGGPPDPEAILTAVRSLLGRRRP